MADNERDVPDLAEQIVRADEEQRDVQEPPMPRGWAGLVERDRRARMRRHPNGIGGVAGLVYSWRLYIATVGALMLVVLLLVYLLE